MLEKVSDYIVKRLKIEGVHTIFGYQGGNISHLIDSIDKDSDIEFVENYHEQAASFAANAYAQVNNSLGVALASSGPGAINMINGIANAFCDSIPCIFFTGDVNTIAKRSDGSRRQNAFQEIDFIPMVRGISKYAVTIDTRESIIEELDKAIEIAKTGRMGPVVINLPHDIQRALVEVNEYTGSIVPKKVNIDIAMLQKASDSINSALRPVLLLGSGMRNPKAKAIIKNYVKKTRIPVVTSLLGLDLISHENECFMGMIGSYGNRAANLSFKYADCIVVLGSRIDDRQIGAAETKLFKNKTIIHVDVDECELENKMKEDISIYGDATNALEYFAEHARKVCVDTKWLDWLFSIKKEYPSHTNNSQSANPNDFLHFLSKRMMDKNTVFTFDVGNNQMYSGESVLAGNSTCVLSSGGLGSMGFSLPAAIGAAYADKTKKVVSINGDGGMQMNIQELNTIDFHKLNVSVVVLNNQALGMIYDLQIKIFKDRFAGTIDGYNAPNFEAIAKAYGFEYFKVKSPDDYCESIDAIENKKRVFIEVIFPVDTKTIPEPGESLFEQLPEIKPSDEYLQGDIV